MVGVGGTKMLVSTKEVKIHSIKLSLKFMLQTIESFVSISSLLFDDLSATCFNSYMGCNASDVITPPPPLP